ncbi:MAG: TIGR02466 family protein [Pseudomonadota bacterium]|nr:TIGR02466 family protein [Pseudomonadota bacterium]
MEVETNFKNTELHALFPCPIQISKLADAVAVNKRLMLEIKRIKKNTPNGRPEVWTSPVYTTLNTSDQLHLLPEFTFFFSEMEIEIVKFAQALGMDYENYPLRMKDCWFNVYRSNDGQEPHNHNNSFISGSYYVSIPDGSSGIRFHSPVCDNMFVPPTSQRTQLNRTLVEVDVEEGDLVLFPSWLKHSVQPAKFKNERISISFNVFM